MSDTYTLINFDMIKHVISTIGTHKPLLHFMFDFYLIFSLYRDSVINITYKFDRKIVISQQVHDDGAEGLLTTGLTTGPVGVWPVVAFGCGGLYIWVSHGDGGPLDKLMLPTSDSGKLTSEPLWGK